MPDDQTLRPKNGIAGGGDRSDERPSSVRPSTTNRADAPGRADRIDVVRHRASRLPSLIQIRQSLRQNSPANAATVAAVLCSLALGTAVASGLEPPPNHTEASRSALERSASRSTEGSPPHQPTSADAAAAAAAPPADQPEAPAPAPPAKPAPPKKQLPPGHLESGPVAGLSAVQMNNAKAIVWTGVDIKMPRRALVIAVATSMQESELLNRASEVLPESKKFPYQGTGWDHDSVGLFQQRTSTGWGRVDQLMDPAYASQQFYIALMRVPGWQQMRLTEAAQAVQVSAFPDHYAKHEARAQQVVNALTDVP